MDIITLALANDYTNQVALGDGAVGIKGDKGDPGREIQLQSNGIHIQWRYVGDSNWQNIIALSNLKGDKGDIGNEGKDGPNGETPEFRMNYNTLQYRFSTESPTNWIDLYTFDSVNSLPSGGIEGQILAKRSNNDGDVEWTNQLIGVIDVKVDTVSVVDSSGFANIDLTNYAQNDDIPDVNDFITEDDVNTKLGEYATIQYVTDAMDSICDGFIPNANQTTAMNSGITEEKVALYDSKPTTEDIVSAISNAINDIEEYDDSEIREEIDNKVDKEAGKGLSSNDYTFTEKNKLAGIAAGANATTITNNLTTSVSGTALDSSQGKILDDQDVPIVKMRLSQHERNKVYINVTNGTLRQTDYIILQHYSRSRKFNRIKYSHNRMYGFTFIRPRGGSVDGDKGFKTPTLRMPKNWKSNMKLLWKVSELNSDHGGYYIYFDFNDLFYSPAPKRKNKELIKFAVLRDQNITSRSVGVCENIIVVPQNMDINPPYLR